MSIDSGLLNELSRVKIDKRELQVLRDVYSGIIGPLQDSLKTITDENFHQEHAFKRIQFYVATLVEHARNGLLQAKASGKPIDFSGLGDLQKLLVYLPEDKHFSEVSRQLSLFQPGSTPQPLEVMRKLGLSMRGDGISIDGRIQSTFSQQQLVEYGCIYMENSQLTPFPTASKPPQSELVH